MTTRPDPLGRPRRTPARRGNTIVLVAAILVLLVIIATSFITRTEGGRKTSAALRNARLSDNNSRLIADLIAGEIGDALFTLPVDLLADVQAQNPVTAASSNIPRLSTYQPQTTRYNIDPQDVNNDNFPDFSYNYAPYQVVPFTNWPDASVLGVFSDPRLPPGEGNQVAVPNVIIAQEGNPKGNPGFGDSRWLAANEPVRWDSDNSGVHDRYSHWRKISNLSRPNNGWRVCRDISNLFDLNLNGVLAANVVENLTIPIEQWFAGRAGNQLFRPDAVDANFEDTQADAGLVGRYFNWMGGGSQDLTVYLNAYANTTLVPGNFFRLSDPESDGVMNRRFEQHQPGTARHTLDRVLADTDGDGYTDAYWHLAPTPTERGIRQIVAVRIVDNSAMLDVNVATRVARADDILADRRRKTRGHTPSDLALTGDRTNLTDYLRLRLGIYDNLDNDEQFGHEWPNNYLPFSIGAIPGNPLPSDDITVRWSRNQWDDHLAAIGVWDFAVDNPADLGEALALESDRLRFWQMSGRRPFTATGGLTPFTLADEIELRMFHGNNHPWIQSRYETTVINDLAPQGNDLLHATQGREEYMEVSGNQLRNRELLFDLRSKLTMYSGARNDELPPWLRERDPSIDVQSGFPIINRRKFDLRATADWRDLNADGLFDLNDEALFVRNLNGLLNRALVWINPSNPINQANNQSYFGTGQNDSDDARRAAASLAANILAYRDRDHLPLRVKQAIVPQGLAPNASLEGYLGLEPQPFFMEAFIGHVYEMFQVPPAENVAIGGDLYTNAGNDIIFSDADLGGTVVAVQLGNPFSETIDLSLFVVSLFGQTYDLANLPPQSQLMPPTTPEQPFTLVLTAIVDAIDGTAMESDWEDFLDIEVADHTDALGTIFMQREEISAWDTNRDVYDSAAGTIPGLALLRKDIVAGGINPLRVVVDRMDPPGSPPGPSFFQSVEDLGNTKPNSPGDDMPVPLDSADIPGPGVYPVGTDLGTSTGDTHFVEWVRATRGWGIDLDIDGLYEPNERSPRYAFGLRTVIVGDDITTGEKFDTNVSPDSPWFARPHHLINGILAVPERKPTFFDFNGFLTNTNQNVPDKGWYTQKNTGGGGLGTPQDNPVTNGIWLDYPYQMLVKNDDFESVGELADVFLWGHELGVRVIEVLPLGSRIYIVDPNSPDPLVSNSGDGGTRKTFSEFLGESILTNGLVSHGLTVNHLDPFRDDSIIRGDFSVPDLPAAVRVFEGFVCDGPGELKDLNNDGVIDADDEFIWRNNQFLLTGNFDRSITPGLINVNTASIEVLRTLPHWYRLVHEFLPPGGDATYPPNPPVSLGEAVVQYRDKIGLPDDISDRLPAYGDRGRAIQGIPGSGWVAGMRNERGIAATGELLLMRRSGKFGKILDTGQIPVKVVYDPAQSVQEALNNLLANSAFRIDGPALEERDALVDDLGGAPVDAFLFPEPDGAGGFFALSAQVSTDPVGRFDAFGNFKQPDMIAEDAEEAGLLYAGASNLLTTRSDVFTVYFRVRSVRQDPVTRRWDATNRDLIVDDTRYVMLVDRSNVERPGDQPRILYLEKVAR